MSFLLEAAATRDRLMPVPRFRSAPDVWCQVLQDYHPKLCDELHLMQGDEIRLISKLEPGWWQGEHNGKV